jgi:uncharacterized membrane protein
MKKAKFVQQPPSGDQVSVSAELLELTKDEEAQFLKQLFLEKFGASALSKAEGTPKTQKSEPGPGDKSLQVLTVDDMKAKLLEGIIVDEGQLRVLAQQRAQQIRESLIQEGKVPSNQVFLVEVALNPMTKEGMVRSLLTLTAK